MEKAKVVSLDFADALVEVFERRQHRYPANVIYVGIRIADHALNIVSAGVVRYCECESRVTLGQHRTDHLPGVFRAVMAENED
jgi:hypothetical protein